MAPPIYLLPAIAAVERVLLTAGEDGMTPAQVAEQLQAEGYRWPLRRTYRTSPGEKGEPTPERVRRVCKLRGGATRIGRVRGSSPIRFRIDEAFGPRGSR